MRQRVVTALILAVPALLALALRTPWPLAALGLVAAGIGGWEADRLLSGRVACLFGSLAVFVAALREAVQGPTPLDGAAATMMVAATFFGVAAATIRRGDLLGRLTSVAAGLWTSVPLLAILLLHRRASGEGVWCLSPALMALVPVWAGDIAAIFAGKAFGKRPLAPKISPKKTVEGSLANLFAAVLVAWALGRLLGLSDARGLGAGVAVGLLGQAGDLFESWLKRRADVKDSGTLLPGHGGVLDRIDSVLFAAPAVAAILLA